MRGVHPCIRSDCTKTSKRSFRRAQNRAAREGRALYKGKWYTSRQLQFDHFSLKQSPKFSGTKTLLPIQNPGEHRRAGRLKFLSWNCGGLPLAKLDEIVAYAEQENIDVVFLQETRWKNNFNWEAGSFLCVHCGETISRGNTWCGLLVLISRKFTNPSLIRWSPILEGRILHLRLSGAHTTWDLLNVYRIPGSDPSREHEREEVWHRLSQVLHALPRRNAIVLAGDYNSSLHAHPPYVGPSLVKPSSHGNFDYLASILETFDLCMLNSWSGSQVHTFENREWWKECH